MEALNLENELEAVMPHSTPPATVVQKAVGIEYQTVLHLEGEPDQGGPITEGKGWRGGRRGEGIGTKTKLVELIPVVREGISAKSNASALTGPQKRVAQHIGPAAAAASGIRPPAFVFGEIAIQTKGESTAFPRNHTGLPDSLKAGIEALSGIALDDVKVHYNSPRPASMQALAYTRGTEIHVAPGQEKHLAHEAWHAVQQKQGRVRANSRKSSVAVNDDPVFEREADLMGRRAAAPSPFQLMCAHRSVAAFDFARLPIHAPAVRVFAPAVVQRKFPEPHEWRFVLGSSPSLKADAKLWVTMLEGFAHDEPGSYVFALDKEERVLINGVPHTAAQLYELADSGAINEVLSGKIDSKPGASLEPGTSVKADDYGVQREGVILRNNGDGTYSVSFEGTQVPVTVGRKDLAVVLPKAPEKPAEVPATPGALKAFHEVREGDEAKQGFEADPKLKHVFHMEDAQGYVWSKDKQDRWARTDEQGRHLLKDSAGRAWWAVKEDYLIPYEPGVVEAVEAYRHDIAHSTAWAHQDQAEALAKHFRISFDLYRSLGPKEIGYVDKVGGSAQHSLYSLYFIGGNHYEVLVAGDAGDLTERDTNEKFKLRPGPRPRSDGSCLYDAFQILLTGEKADESRIGRLREIAAGETSTESIIDDIRALIGHRKSGRGLVGLGPKMRRILHIKDEADLTPEDIAAIIQLLESEAAEAQDQNLYREQIAILNSLTKKPEPPALGPTKGPAFVKGARDLMVVGSHMSGDMYGVAAAMAIRPAMSVLVLTDGKENHLRTFHAMVQLFQTVADRNAKAGGMQKVYTKADLTDVNTEWKGVKGWTDPETKDTKFNIIPVVSESRFLAEDFRKSPETTHVTIRAKWLGTPEEQREDAERTQKYLEQKGIGPGRYTLVWAKTGPLTHPHAHHYTLGAASRLNLFKQVTDSGRTPVAIGDTIEGADTNPTLTKFWEDGGFPFKAEGRIGQLKFHFHFATAKGYDVIHMGARSGILEGPALLGLKVVYFEERANAQATRWEPLLELLPNFRRIILDAPPGAAEKKLWIENILWKNHKSKVLKLTKNAVAKLLELSSTDANKVADILLRHEDITTAHTELLTLSKFKNSERQKGIGDALKRLLAEGADKLAKTGGKDVWSKEKLQSLTAEAEDPKTGEGLSSGESATLRQVLGNWDKGPQAESPVAREYYKRTWLENKPVKKYPRKAETDWTAEYQARELLRNTGDASRDDVALLLARNSALAGTIAFQQYGDQLRREIVADFAGQFDTQKRAMGDWLKTLDIYPQIGGIGYEQQRLHSRNPHFDRDWIAGRLNPQDVLVTRLGFGKAAVSEVLDKVGGSLLAAYSVLTLAKQDVRFLPEYQDAPLEAEPIGTGKQKNVYALQANSNLVMAVMHVDKADYFALISKEISMINMVAKWGIPVVKILGVTTSRSLPAVVMVRYAEHSKDFVAKNIGKEDPAPEGYRKFGEKAIKISATLSGKSIKGLLEAEKTMVEKQIRIKDLQFLIHQDGSVVVADPGNVIEGHGPSVGEIGVIDNLIATAADGALRAQPDVSPERVVTIDALAAVIGIPANDERIGRVATILKERYRYTVEAWKPPEKAPVKHPAKAQVKKQGRAEPEKGLEEKAEKEETPAERILSVLAANDGFVELKDDYGDDDTMGKFGLSKKVFDLAVFGDSKTKGLKGQRKVSPQTDGLHLASRLKK